MAELRTPNTLERQLFVELVHQYHKPGSAAVSSGLRKLRSELKRFGYVATPKGLMVQLEEDVDFDDSSVLEFIDLMKRVGQVSSKQGWDRAA